ncbi:tRNA pseudouridine synthase A [subsurface metagenome]
MAVRNIKLTIVYDGTEYHGWQIQPGLRTIAGVLTDAIQDLIDAEVRLFGASRTDAGVSALGQVGLVQIDSAIPTENLARAITDKLPPDIAVAEAVEVAEGFDLMGAVKSKLYRYTIFTGRVRPVLEIRHCWHLPAKLDITAMAEAAKLLVGKKDFKSFAAAADKREETVRTIFRCDVVSSRVVRDASCEKEKMDSCFRRNDNTQYAVRNTQYENDWIYVDVEGDGFLYNMVRNIVGTLVEVGVGRWRPEKINKILEAKDRTTAGRLAPAQGLCLMWIKY